MSDFPEASRRQLARWLAGIFGVLLVGMVLFGLWNRRNIANIARNWDSLTEGSAIARELHYPEDLLEYIVKHPDGFSIVSYELGDEANGLFLNADRPRAVAGVSALWLLCDYNAAVDTGALRPNEPVAISEWEKYWLPQTDGGAHERTLTQLRTSKEVSNDQVQLQDVVYGMTRFSDNAATDYVMKRLGRERLSAVAAQYGSTGDEAPLPWAGLYLSWESTGAKVTPADQLARYRAGGHAAYADRVWRLADALHDDPQLRAAELARLSRKDGLTSTLGEQALLAKELTPHGSARSYAQLMARIARGELVGSAAIQAELSWPLQQPQLRSRFEQYGTKSGSLPGILATVTYAKHTGAKNARVAAIFSDALPMAVWLELMHTFIHERLEQDLLSDPEFFARVKERTAGLDKR